MGILYKVTSPSNKSYIGITSKTLDVRWSNHIKDAKNKRSSSLLHKAIRKYGHEAFHVEILAESNNWQELCSMEIETIDKLGTFAPNGYNSTIGGDGVIGLTSEAKKRHRNNTAIGTKKAWDNGTLRSSRAATFATEEFRDKHAKATSIGTSKALQIPEIRKRYLEAVKSDNFRNQASENMKLLWQDPVYRASQVAKRRTRPPRSEESKRRQSEKMKLLIAERKKTNTLLK